MDHLPRTGFSPPNRGGRPGYTIGEAIAWAWTVFARNAGSLVAASVILGIIGVAVATLLGTLLNAVSPETFSAVQTGDNVVETATSAIDGAGLAVLVPAWLAVLFAGGVIASAWYSGLLLIADGQRSSVVSFLRPRNAMSVGLAAVLTGSLAGLLGLLAVMVPDAGVPLSVAFAALVAVVTFFCAVAIVDRDLSAFAGIRAAFQTFRTHPGPVALAWIVSTAVLVAGGVVLAGLIVALPIAYLFKVFVWRRLSGGRVVVDPATGVAG